MNITEREASLLRAIFSGADYEISRDLPKFHEPTVLAVMHIYRGQVAKHDPLLGEELIPRQVESQLTPEPTAES